MIGSAKLFAATTPTVGFSAFATPSSVFEIGPIGGLTSGNVTINTTGTTSPYTYLWTKLSGDTIIVNSPTSGVTSFSNSGGIGDESNSVYRCTVTDSLLVAVTVDVPIQFFFGFGS